MDTTLLIGGAISGLLTAAGADWTAYANWRKHSEGDVKFDWACFAFRTAGGIAIGIATALGVGPAVEIFG